LSLPIIRPDWPAPPSINAFTSTRAGGVSLSRWASLNLGLNCGDQPEHVMQNRSRLSLLLPAAPAWLKQVHGIHVVHHDGHLTPEPEADAVISRTAGCVCAVLTADCLPVLLAGKKGTEVAAVHAGWRGLAAGILERTIADMQSNPADLLAWIGPGIGASAYQVGEEVYKAFCSENPDAHRAFRASGGRWMADLALLARQRLEGVGISQVFGGNICTYTQDRDFFSHRRDGPTGRMASVIWIQNEPGLNRRVS